MKNEKEPINIEQIFELMVKHQIETYEHDGYKITRKSLDLQKESNSQAQILAEIKRTMSRG